MNVFFLAVTSRWRNSLTSAEVWSYPTNSVTPSWATTTCQSSAVILPASRERFFWASNRALNPVSSTLRSCSLAMSAVKSTGNPKVS